MEEKNKRETDKQGEGEIKLLYFLPFRFLCFLFVFFFSDLIFHLKYVKLSKLYEKRESTFFVYFVFYTWLVGNLWNLLVLSVERRD